MRLLKLQDLDCLNKKLDQANQFEQDTWHDFQQNRKQGCEEIPVLPFISCEI